MNEYNTSGEERSTGALLASVSTVTNVNPGERMISLLSGLALATAGIRNLKKGNGISLVLGGAYLVARGITGYCVVNALVSKSKLVKNVLPQTTGTFKVVSY